MSRIARSLFRSVQLNRGINSAIRGCSTMKGSTANISPVLLVNAIAKTSKRFIQSQPPSEPEESLLDINIFERVCSNTIEDLADHFEAITEETSILSSAPDVTYSDGVLTVKLDSNHGTYVINRQTPNRQIWLSSPTSGPKRFDFVPKYSSKLTEGRWIYKHTGQSLHELLQEEIRVILKDAKVDFLNLCHSN